MAVWILIRPKGRRGGWYYACIYATYMTYIYLNLHRLFFSFGTGRSTKWFSLTTQDNQFYGHQCVMIMDQFSADSYIPINPGLGHPPPPNGFPWHWLLRYLAAHHMLLAHAQVAGFACFFPMTVAFPRSAWGGEVLSGRVSRRARRCYRRQGCCHQVTIRLLSCPLFVD